MGQVIVTTHECHFRPSFSKFAGYYFLRPTKKWMESADGRWVLKFKKNYLLHVTTYKTGNVLWIDHLCNVIEIGTNRKTMCDFLLVFHCNIMSVVYRFIGITT